MGAKLSLGYLAQVKLSMGRVIQSHPQSIGPQNVSDTHIHSSGVDCVVLL